jgi:hypothetical protein
MLTMSKLQRMPERKRHFPLQITLHSVLLTGRFDGIVSVGLILVTSLLSGSNSSVGG